MMKSVKKEISKVPYKIKRTFRNRVGEDVSVQIYNQVRNKIWEQIKGLCELIGSENRVD